LEKLGKISAVVADDGAGADGVITVHLKRPGLEADGGRLVLHVLQLDQFETFADRSLSHGVPADHLLDPSRKHHLPQFRCLALFG
jgi:hypothetical protein